MPNRLPSRLVCAAVLLLASPARAFAEANVDPINDCGVNSLYLLLRLHSRDVNLSDLRRALPHPGMDGLSMADLQSAASSHGVSLRGTRLRREDFPLDRPIIALLRTEDDGHFVVLQPVGATGTMAMILDFPRPPKIVDHASLSDSEDWNGLALVPVRPWESAFPYSVGIAASVLAASLSYRLRARLRGRAPAWSSTRSIS